MLGLEPAAEHPRPDSLRCQTPTARMERDIQAALTPAHPPHRSSRWLPSPTLSVHAAGGTASPADFPENQGTERNKNRTIPRPDPTLSGLFSFGDGWHRSLPQEAAKVPSADFFFSYFHCAARVKAVAFGSYFPSALLLFPSGRDLFSTR